MALYTLPSPLKQSHEVLILNPTGHIQESGLRKTSKLLEVLAGLRQTRMPLFPTKSAAPEQQAFLKGIVPTGCFYHIPATALILDHFISSKSSTEVPFPESFLYVMDVWTRIYSVAFNENLMQVHVKKNGTNYKICYLPLPFQESLDFVYLGQEISRLGDKNINS